MKKSRLYTCELKRYRHIAPELCAVCERVDKCKSFRLWYQSHSEEYIKFVLDIIEKFPEKYELEVRFMAEKVSKSARKQFVQVVDMESGKIERIVNLDEIEALTPEEKLALSKNKNLFIVSHRLEPVVTITMKRTTIEAPITFEQETEEEEAVKEEVPKPKTRKKS